MKAYTKAEAVFAKAVENFQICGGTPERVLEIVAEVLGDDFISAAGRVLRGAQTDPTPVSFGSNRPPEPAPRTVFDPEIQRMRKEEQRGMVQITKRTVVVNFLTKVMPNGKELRDCTGRDCTRMGGWFLRIAERVKPNQKVGNALTEEEIQKLMGPKAA